MFNFLEGEILLIDKPLTWTSFNVVSKIKFLLKRQLKVKKIKVGHAGTLDPLATGLLVVCTGKKTKEIPGLIGQDKEYTGVFKLGATTPSFDLETEINETFAVDHITEELVKETSKQFLGEQKQYPPIFSAKRINGKRAYEYARKGEEVQVRPNMVEIKEFDILKFENNEIHFRIKCSKGTYIRSIANDFGLALNSGAHLIELRRISSGNFSIEDSLSIEEIEKIIKSLEYNL